MSGADENLVSPFSVDSWVTIFLCIIIDIGLKRGDIESLSILMVLGFFASLRLYFPTF